MSKFRTPDDIVVSVADEHDGILTGLYYKKVSSGRSSSRHTDPTPSGSIRRQQAASEETPTGQIRRQQAQDPFGNR